MGKLREKVDSILKRINNQQEINQEDHNLLYQMFEIDYYNKMR